MIAEMFDMDGSDFSLASITIFTTTRLPRSRAASGCRRVDDGRLMRVSHRARGYGGMPARLPHTASYSFRRRYEASSMQGQRNAAFIID